jgi:uncharacterized protein YbaA (DUF1428 family)
MYVDGFVVPVPKEKKDAYRAMAAAFAAVAKEHGALTIVECWADDVPPGKVTDFYRAVQCTEEETVVFSWITWPDKAARDAGNAKLATDARLTMETFTGVVDGKRMIYGGFAPILTA